MFYISNKICKQSLISIDFIASVYELFDKPWKVSNGSVGNSEVYFLSTCSISTTNGFILINDNHFSGNLKNGETLQISSNGSICSNASTNIFFIVLFLQLECNIIFRNCEYFMIVAISEINFHRFEYTTILNRFMQLQSNKNKGIFKYYFISFFNELSKWISVSVVLR